METRQIFISYSRANLEQVKAIKADIERATGADCWMDLEGIESGVPSFTKAIIEGIEQCEVFLFMRSRQSQDSKFALRELSYATEDAHKHVVIVNIDDSAMNKEFKFLYKYTDTIDWNNQPQRDKLIRDLRLWTGSAVTGGLPGAGTQPLSSASGVRSFFVRFKWWLLGVAAVLLLLIGFFARTNAGGESGRDAVGQNTSLLEQAFGQYHTSNFGEAYRLFAEAAESQDVTASYYLGLMCEKGQGTGQSYVEAAKWYNDAAKLGHADSQLRLGMLYFNGEGVPEDNAEALKWFLEAAKQDNTEAQYMLGEMYSNGWGTNADASTAVKWYKLAARAGLAKAQNALGKIYCRGYGIAADYEEAVKWFRMSADQDDPEGACELGDMYKYGNGVAQSYAEAMKWYLKAAEQDYQLAQMALATMYANGHGVPADEEEARKWYLKALHGADTLALER